MSQFTLSIDCGGLFIKSCVLDESGTMHAAPTRVQTPYPLTTERFLQTVSDIA
jgi:polyphosphate glucokinase